MPAPRIVLILVVSARNIGEHALLSPNRLH